MWQFIWEFFNSESSPFRQPANIREGGKVLSYKPGIALITISQVFPQLLFLKLFYHWKMHERIRWVGFFAILMWHKQNRVILRIFFPLCFVMGKGADMDFYYKTQLIIAKSKKNILKNPRNTYFPKFSEWCCLVLMFISSHIFSVFCGFFSWQQMPVTYCQS